MKGACQEKTYPMPAAMSPTSLLIILEEVDGILLHILPAVVVAHDGLRVPVLRHHLQLSVCQTTIERPSDGCPSEVVWGEVTYPRVVGPSLDDLLHLSRGPALTHVNLLPGSIAVTFHKAGGTFGG